MPILKKIWISNSCGAIYLFENVPTDKDDDNDISEWFESNEIGDEVGNNFNSCNWGELTKTIYEVRTPENGWNEYIDSEDEELESVTNKCDECQQSHPLCSRWRHEDRLCVKCCECENCLSLI